MFPSVYSYGALASVLGRERPRVHAEVLPPGAFGESDTQRPDVLPPCSVSTAKNSILKRSNYPDAAGAARGSSVNSNGGVAAPLPRAHVHFATENGRYREPGGGRCGSHFCDGDDMAVNENLSRGEDSALMGGGRKQNITVVSAARGGRRDNCALVRGARGRRVPGPMPHSLHHHDEEHVSKGENLPAQLSSVGKQRPLELLFESVCASAGKRQVLSNISGHVRPGEILAVMGPSGSGKTTLLNVLSGRLRPDSGAILLNGEPLNKHLKRKVCYVLQEDIFFAHLTLRQTLMYAAQLRLPDSLSYADKARHVDHIINILDLSRCQHTRIGEYMKGGLSGGEKKRANIGCELLTNPALMLLDEPSTGLDSSATFSLIKNLKEYALKEKKTIVLTVHQPSSQAFHMFDKLLLLCNGQCAYFGDIGNVVSHFGGLGLEIKPHYNPADFIMEQLKAPEETVQKILLASAGLESKTLDTPYSSTCSLYSSQCADRSDTSEALRHLCGCGEKASWSGNDTSADSGTSPQLCNNCLNSKTSELRILIEDSAMHKMALGSDRNDDSGTSTWSNDTQSHGSDDDYVTDRWSTCFWTQFKVLTARNFREACPRVLSRLNLLLTVVLAVLAGLVWFQSARTEESIADYQGWIFFSTNYWMLFSLFGALFAFPSQQKVVNKERASGAYRLSAFYLARMFGELPLLVVPPTLYFVISYPMMGCSSIAAFVQLLLFLLLNSVVAESVGVFFGVACMDFQVGNTVGAIFTCGTQLFGGFLSTHIPAGLRWMRYLSMVGFAYQNMQIVEFTNGPPFKCAAENSKFSSCVSGNSTYIPREELLTRRGDTLPFELNMAALLAFMVVFRVMGYVVLRFFRTPTH